MDSVYDLSQSSIGCSSDNSDYDAASLFAAPVVDGNSSLSDSIISGPRNNTSIASAPPSSQDPNWMPTSSIPPIAPAPIMDTSSDSLSPEGGDLVTHGGGRTSADGDAREVLGPDGDLDSGCTSAGKDGPRKPNSSLEAMGRGLSKSVKISATPLLLNEAIPAQSAHNGKSSGSPLPPPTEDPPDIQPSTMTPSTTLEELTQAQTELTELGRTCMRGVKQEELLVTRRELSLIHI